MLAMLARVPSAGWPRDCRESYLRGKPNAILGAKRVASANRAFLALVGLPLTDMWRYFGCQKFEFGEQKPQINSQGEETTWADWGLVACAAWTLSGPEGFELSSDHFEPERRDLHAREFYQSLDVNPPAVQQVQVLFDGALSISLTGGYRLSLQGIPPNEEKFEAWRLMPPDEDPRGHLTLDWDGLCWSHEPDGLGWSNEPIPD